MSTCRLYCRCPIPYCWFSRARSPRPARTPIMSPSMTAWRVYARYTRSIWNARTPTCPPSPTTSASCSTLWTSSRTCHVSSIRSRRTRTRRITRTGSRRRSTSCWGDRRLPQDENALKPATLLRCHLWKHALLLLSLECKCNVPTTKS